MSPARPLRSLPPAIPLLVLLVLAPPAPAREGDEHLPVRAEVSVDDADLPRTGFFTLRLRFVPLEDLDRAHLVKVVVGRGRRELIVREVVPDPPTRRWRAGRAVELVLPTSFPLDPGLPRGDAAEIRLGFVDAETRDVTAPADTWPYASGLSRVGEMTIPTFRPVPDLAAAEALIETAREFRAAGRPQDAWDVLELGVRMADADEVKYALRDELLELGDLPPRPLTVEEERIVATRIEDEQARWFRLVAGRMYDRRRYHGALLLLERVGGALAERADDAVLGALDEARRTERKIDDVRQALLDHVPDEDRVEVEALEERVGLTRRLLEAAERLERKGRSRAARWLDRRLRRADDPDVASEAAARLPALEEAILSAVPDDEREEVEAALEHPAWARTVTVPSHRFLFIGPRRMVEGIPPESRLRFDLAYVFLTDLFGRVPNPNGDRVTVYFKELWDFGGGVGGGKTIDIGRADPDARRVRVDTGLLYHELTHCVDDTAPIFEGFREGLANVGAVYAFEALAQDEDGLHSFERNLEQFRTDYLARDLEYWRIQNYGPSAGFFLHFLDRYAKRGSGHDWSTYRRFFREYRDAPVRDGREPFVARAMAHYLMRAFGDEAFDDLVRFRWPLASADRGAVGREIAAFDRGGLSDFADAHEEFPNSPLPRDLLVRELKRLAADGDDAAARAFGRERLGLVYTWKVIGPFSRDGVDPGAAVFPPEETVDFDARYTVRNNIAFWTEPAAHAPVIGLPTGWVRIEFPYQDDTATYALTHVTVPAAADAVAHVRADDDLALRVNGARIGEYHGRGWNASSRLGWRGPHFEAPDAIRFPLRLPAGRSAVLLKVRNHRGPAGFSLALSRPDGTAIEGLVADAGPPDPPPPTPETGWAGVTRQVFRSSHGGKLDVAVGRFRVRNKALQGVSTDGKVPWRKFTVRPGFPKDSPSNLAWLDDSITDGITSFRLRLTVEGSEAPKLVVTFQGEGGEDGLSGWSLITRSRGDAVQARLERYDRLVHQSAPHPLEPAEERTLELTVRDDRVSARLGDAVLFDQVPIRPIAGRHRIGFATWGERPRIRRLSLEEPDG